MPGGRRIVGFVIVRFMEGGGRRKPWPLHRKVGVTRMCGGDWLRGSTNERELRDDAKIRVCMGKVSGCCCTTQTFGWLGEVFAI